MLNGALLKYFSLNSVFLLYIIIVMLHIFLNCYKMKLQMLRLLMIHCVAELMISCRHLENSVNTALSASAGDNDSYTIRYAL